MEIKKEEKTKKMSILDIAMLRRTKRLAREIRIGISAALSAAKTYTDEVFAAFPDGTRYLGSVNYYLNLPDDAEIGDTYTVKYTGTTGTSPSGIKYVWGNDSGIERWIEWGADLKLYARTDGSYILMRVGLAENLVDTTKTGTLQLPFTIRQTGGDEQITDDGTAQIKSIRGRTLVWNQLIYNGNFESGTDGWSQMYGSISAESGILRYTLTSSGTSRNSARIEKKDFELFGGHKYYISYKVRPPRDATMRFGYTSRPDHYRFETEAGKWKDVHFTFIPSSDGNATLYFYVDILYDLEVGDEVLFKDIAISDLTVDYGDGNEPSSDQFRIEFPLSYYGYTDPVLLSFAGTGIKSEGNGWSETRAIPTTTYFPGGMRSVGTVYDELTPDKAVTRIGSRAYAEGDEDDPTVLTDGTTTLYPLDTPVETPISPPLNLSYRVENGGTETLIPSDGTSSPISAIIAYDIDYVKQINQLRQNLGSGADAAEVAEAILSAKGKPDGDYTLKASIVDDAVIYSWEPVEGGDIV